MARAGGYSNGRDIGAVFNYPNPDGPSALPMCGGVGAQSGSYLGPEHSAVPLQVGGKAPLAYAALATGMSREEQERALAALTFKCGVLWALLDAVARAYPDPAHG